MAARNLLHKSKLESFKSWLDSKGLEHRPGRGDYQELQVRTGKTWHVIYSRNYMPEHLTIPDPIISLVSNFIRQNRAAVVVEREDI